MSQPPETFKLQAERAAELLRASSRHAEVLERQLKQLMSFHGLESETADIAEPIAPLHGARLGDVGAYAPRPAPGRVAPPTTWPSRRVAPPTLKPSAGHAHHAIDLRRQRVVGFDVRDLARNALAYVLDEVDRRLADNAGVSPIFIYDGEDFDLFRARGWVLEWIPPARDRARCGGASDWDDYLADRLALLGAKWGVASFTRIASDAAALNAATADAMAGQGQHGGAASHPEDAPAPPKKKSERRRVAKAAATKTGGAVTEARQGPSRQPCQRTRRRACGVTA